MSDEEGDKSHLQSFFAMVMSGLAGSSTTMVGATIFALARLLFEFSAALIAAVPELLPAVLLLIKTHNRETVKAVLGFIRVVAIRLPVDQLTPLLDQILTAMLVWGSDDKNRHRMKVCISQTINLLCLPKVCSPISRFCILLSQNSLDVPATVLLGAHPGGAITTAMRRRCSGICTP